jgi:hypothetical protein
MIPLLILIVLSIVAFFIFKLVHYKEPFNPNISYIKKDAENIPTPYNFVIPPLTPSVYKENTNTEVDKTFIEPINDEYVNNKSKMNIYQAYMNTDCKNNFCCEDGMTYNEELGVCIKNNDNSYLNEFNALGPTPPERLNTKQIDKIYKGVEMK